ncbi:GumC family protein [Confluentibacter flavum]|uniref:non-specific protein-tyrosine kinase n=1 Tax=Confluentibacter flavum TaxID=1909700 RepID=A0A2N3HGH0_9FLAO|nr:polysaccharide biosynthesis tyrosine autokinase [Confluentibacter flavum]PKQ44055.1 tyrosine protein kinase [Confluentibacter flavum]
MVSSSKQNQSKNTMSEEVNLKKTLFSYARHWKWFALSCILCIIAALLYLRYTPEQYSAYAKIMFVDDATSSIPSNELLKDLRRYSETEGKKTEDEIEALRSRHILESVVRKLSLNIQYSSKGRVHETPLYKKSPIKINFTVSDSIVEHSKFNFSINILSETAFDFEVENEAKELVSIKSAFGKNIPTPMGDIIILPTVDNMSQLVGQTIYVKIVPVKQLAEFYKNEILVSQIVEFSKVVDLSLNDVVLSRSKDILNTLIEEYNRISIAEKNQISLNAANFINERINLISKDLSNVDDKIENFKTGNRLTDITSEASLYLNTSSQTEEEISKARSQLNLVNYMKNYVDDESLSYEPIPSNVGLSDESINNVTSTYNDLLRERNALLKGSTKEKNPIIVNLDQQLSGLKQNLIQSLANSSQTISFQINSLQNRAASINSKIYQVPGQVRESRDIEREQGIKESLYLYLLQKREEATISLTSTSPNARIIDEAYSTGLPVSPKKNIVFLAAIIIGLCIPFGVIYTRNLLDTKIHNKEDLEREIKNISILGEIPKIKDSSKSGKGLLIEKNDRSVFSESFRIIRTNFDYIRRGRNIEKYENVMFVTSTINGEGKSVFSLNMALTIANTDKRVLLIEGDIRNPQIHPAIKNQMEKSKAKVGLTEFLVDKSILAGQTIDTYTVNDIKIDILLSGKVPPNPAELLMGDRVQEVFDYASNHYDMVIVDTAPAMLVTDTLLISHYAGHTIYVTRADYTEKQILNYAKELHADKKLNGMMLVVNDVKQSNFGYGAKYGYYGAPVKKGFFSRKS